MAEQAEIDIIKREVKRGHTVISKLELLTASGAVKDTIDDMVSGNVEIDASNAIRRSFNAAFPDREIYDALFQPGVTEVMPYRGVLVGAQKIYYPLGIFGVSENGNGAISKRTDIKCFDRARRVMRRKLTSYYDIPKNTNFGTAIRNLIDSRYPGLTYLFEQTEFTTPHLVFAPQDDPWQRAQEMAISIGMNLYFNEYGAVRLFPLQDANTTAPSGEYTEDGKNFRLLDVSRRRTDAESYNHIIVSSNSQGDDVPTWAEAIDDVPTSPTYIGNPVGSSSFGDIPFWFESKYVISQAQCQSMANAELRRRSGLIESVEITTLVDPTLDADQVIKVESPTGRVDSTYAIESMSMPLGPKDPLNINMRKKNVK